MFRVSNIFGEHTGNEYFHCLMISFIYITMVTLHSRIYLGKVGILHHCFSAYYLKKRSIKALSVEQTAQITSVQCWLKTEQDGLLTEVINKIERLFSDQKHETIICFKIFINYPYKKIT